MELSLRHSCLLLTLGVEGKQICFPNLRKDRLRNVEPSGKVIHEKEWRVCHESRQNRQAPCVGTNMYLILSLFSPLFTFPLSFSLSHLFHLSYLCHRYLQVWLWVTTRLGLQKTLDDILNLRLRSFGFSTWSIETFDTHSHSPFKGIYSVLEPASHLLWSPYSSHHCSSLSSSSWLHKESCDPSFL